VVKRYFLVSVVGHSLNVDIGLCAEKYRIRTLISSFTVDWYTTVWWLANFWLTYYSLVTFVKIAKILSLNGKFNTLVQRRDYQRQKPEPIYLENFVINKSSQTFSWSWTYPSKKGLNFAIKPETMSLMDIIASVESGIQYLSDKVKTDVRRHIKKITEQEISKANFANDSNRQTMALLKEKIVILPKQTKATKLL
jgi:hypothetical protein